MDAGLREYLEGLFGQNVKNAKPLAIQINDLSEKVKILVDHTNTLTTAVNKLTQLFGSEKGSIQNALSELKIDHEKRLSIIEVMRNINVSLEPRYKFIK